MEQGEGEERGGVVGGRWAAKKRKKIIVFVLGCFGFVLGASGGLRR